jgi:hypothetical protein
MEYQMCGKRKSKVKRSWDLSGGLEGLPLQLIIMMVIAGIGISIVVGWLAVFSEKPLSDLEIFDIEPAEEKGEKVLTNGIQYSIKIRALDSDRKPMNGVSVILEGPGLNKIATTDSEGIATFSGVTPDLGPNRFVGIIEVTGSYKSRTIVGPQITIEG